MALTRKSLKGMGLTDEQIDSIVEMHTETVDGLKTEIDALKEKTESIEKITKERDDLKKAAEERGADPFKIKYEAIKEEYAKYKTDVENAKTKGAKETAYKALLKATGLSEKLIDKVAKLADLDKLTLDDDGKITESEKITESIKTEWGDFITTDGRSGAHVPPSGGAGGTGKPDDELTDDEYYAKRLAESKK